ncbi:MAG TPA: hypothetical protein VEK07_15215 [Polyangiaceae bacterium]|nr:hypothetical protein [Polyangiaceae bacterium]
MTTVPRRRARPEDAALEAIARATGGHEDAGAVTRMPSWLLKVEHNLQDLHVVGFDGIVRPDILSSHTARDVDHLPVDAAPRKALRANDRLEGLHGLSKGPRASRSGAHGVSSRDPGGRPLATAASSSSCP